MLFRRFSLARLRRRRHSVVIYRVLPLEGAVLSYQMDSRTPGGDLLRRVLDDLHLPERDMFGLMLPHSTRADRDTCCYEWVDSRKSLRKQVSGQPPHTLHLRVQCYPQDHRSLLPSTRHQLFLQVKKDLFEQRLNCSSSENLRLKELEMAATAAQESAMDHGYSSECVSTNELEAVAPSDAHDRHAVSLSPSPKKVSERVAQQCCGEYLDAAQLRDGYGTYTYTVMDSEHNRVAFSVAPRGVEISRRAIGFSRFDWNSILKISTRGKHLTMCVSNTLSLRVTNNRFTCSSSHMSHCLEAECLRHQAFHCSMAAKQPQSKLRRFLSFRSSGRRQMIHSSGASDSPLKKTASFSARHSFTSHRHPPSSHHHPPSSHHHPPSKHSHHSKSSPTLINSHTLEVTSPEAQEAGGTPPSPPPIPTPTYHYHVEVEIIETHSTSSAEDHAHPDHTQDHSQQQEQDLPAPRTRPRALSDHTPHSIQLRKKGQGSPLEDKVSDLQCILKYLEQRMSTEQSVGTGPKTGMEWRRAGGKRPKHTLSLQTEDAQEKCTSTRMVRSASYSSEAPVGSPPHVTSSTSNSSFVSMETQRRGGVHVDPHVRSLLLEGSSHATEL